MPKAIKNSKIIGSVILASTGVCRFTQLLAESRNHDLIVINHTLQPAGISGNGSAAQ